MRRGHTCRALPRAGSVCASRNGLDHKVAHGQVNSDRAVGRSPCEADQKRIASPRGGLARLSSQVSRRKVRLVLSHTVDSKQVGSGALVARYANRSDPVFEEVVPHDLRMLAGNHGNNTISAWEVKNGNEAQLVAFKIRENKQVNGCRTLCLCEVSPANGNHSAHLSHVTLFRVSCASVGINE